MSWFYLLFAGLFEIAWAFGLKVSDGFSRPLPTTITVACMALSVGLLALALRTLPLSTAYPIWTGIGCIGAFVVGVIVLGESVDAVRAASVLLIAAGMVGLKLGSGAV